MALVDVLIPTYRRKTGLAVVLSSLLGQTFTDFDVIVSDQTEDEDMYLDSIELWMGPIRPEPFTRNSIPWHRHMVNNAANPLHLEQRLAPDGGVVRYKVAWIGGANVLYDRVKLLDVGGFSWWRRLPPEHAGEEVVVQFLLIRKFGGCGILPSGTYHLGLPTTIEDRKFNATEIFEELVREYNVPPVDVVEQGAWRGQDTAPDR